MHLRCTKGTADAVGQAPTRWSLSCHPACLVGPLLPALLGEQWHREATAPDSQVSKKPEPTLAVPSEPLHPSWQGRQVPTGTLSLPARPCPHWDGVPVSHILLREGGFKPRAPAWQHPTAKRVALIIKS